MLARIQKWEIAGEQTGRPLGSASFVEGSKNASGRFLRPKKVGRKPRNENK
jgi:hypothetical protein